MFPGFPPCFVSTFCFTLNPLPFLAFAGSKASFVALGPRQLIIISETPVGSNHGLFDFMGRMLLAALPYQVSYRDASDLLTLTAIIASAI